MSQSEAEALSGRAEHLFHEALQRVYRRRDRVIAALMAIQCVLAVVVALIYSPYTWTGKIQSTHLHVYYALFIGPALSGPVILLTILRPGAAITRHAAAISQMLWSALLIHLTGGRIETHFHVFGSLALLAFYRDWRVMIPATLVVSIDHLLRGMFWPESVYGITNPEWWRFLEHAGWVVFEDVVLVFGILDNLREMRALARRQAELEHLNSTIERKVQERTDELQIANAALERGMSELKKTQGQLVEASRRAGMAEVASGVLHNVGNVLNSVNIATDSVEAKVRRSKVVGLGKVVDLMASRSTDLASFLTSDDKGKRLPAYLVSASKDLIGEREDLLTEIGDLRKNVDHVKTVIAMQQKYARDTVGVREACSLEDLVDDALRMSMEGDVTFAIERRFESLPRIMVDKHVLLQVLVNLFTNARQALKEGSAEKKTLSIGVSRAGSDRIAIEVRDNGVGISADNMNHIFAHGFTTKKEGNGFGLHMSALATKSMGGALTCQSEGRNKGASFVFEIPMTEAKEGEAWRPVAFSSLTTTT